MFPVLGSHVREHQPPGQEKILLTVVEKGGARVVHALAPLLEHHDFTVRSEALAAPAT